MKTCFICNSQCISYFNPEVEITSYTGKSIPDIFSQITNLIPVNFDYICQSCMIKCNEFDEHSTKAEEISKLFLDYLQQPRTEIKEEKQETDGECIIQYEPLIEFKKEFLKNEEISNEKDVLKITSKQHFMSLPDEDPTKKLPYIGKTSCSICKKTFKNKFTLKTHLRIHQKSPHQKLRKLPKSDEKKKFPCHFPDCPWSFSSRHQLTKHQDVHSDERKYKCEVCNKTYKNIHSFSDHKRNIHGWFEKPRNHIKYCDIVECDCCGKKARKDNFLDHFRRMHLSLGKLICSVCGKGIFGNSNLKIHMAVHADEDSKKIICDLCGKRFFNKSRLKEHMKNNHMEKVKNKECHICNKKFILHYTMKKHIRTVHLHKMKDYIPTAIDVVCNICGKLLDSRRSLAKHMSRYHNSTPLN